MTTPNNDELRADIRLMVLKAAVNGDLTMKDLEGRNIEHQHLMLGMPYLEDLFLNFFATHDQQLLEAILEGLRGKVIPCNTDGEIQLAETLCRDFEEHIKSVFNKEGGE